MVAGADPVPDNSTRVTKRERSLCNAGNAACLEASLNPASSESVVPRPISPLWGLWLAFAAAAVACAEGLISHRLPYFEAVTVVCCLSAVTKLAANALGVPAHPFKLEPIRALPARVVSRLRVARPHLETA